MASFSGSPVRPHQVPFTRAQVSFLKKAFEKNRLPDHAARTKMAMKLGIKEPKIRAWFEKQRMSNPEHGEEPSSLSDGTDGGRPHPADQQQNQNVNLTTPTANCNPSSEPCCKDQTSLPAALESQEFVPGDSFGVSGSRASSTLIPQPTEAVQGGQNPDAPLIPINPLSEQPHPEQDFSGTQAPFYSQPDAEREKQQSEDPDYSDISYIMQWWDKDRLDLIANWDPQKEA
ncbi:hypothetical protein STEG23_022413 [Scotinomys teguina]